MRKIIKLFAVFILILQSSVYFEGGVSAEGITPMSSSEPNYVLATNDDFNGEKNGTFHYIGNEEYVEIPHTINGKDVTSYESMFKGTNVKGVESTNENVTNMREMFYGSKATELYLSKFDTSNVTNMSGMFRGSQVTDLDLSSFDTSSITNMEYMFWDSQATELDLSSFDTSNVTDMGRMFENSQATELDLSEFDTGNVTNMSGMFWSSQATDLDLSSFDTSSVGNMSNMFTFNQARALDLSSFDTSNVTDMGRMFSNSQTTELDLSEFDTGNVTNMSGMFRGSKATELDLSSFDTSSVTNMNSMFSNSQATELDLSSFDTSSVTNMNSMFSNGQATELDVSSFNTSKVTDMGWMFYNSQATELDLSSFDTGSVMNMWNMFNDSQATKVYARTQEDADNFNESSNKPSELTFKIKDADGFVTATDGDFSVKENGEFRYIGTDEYVEIPHVIKGEPVTSYHRMFSDLYGAETSNVKGVKSTNDKVTNMHQMFLDSKATELDLSSFDTGNVTNMSGMFMGSRATELDLSKFDTSKVMDMSGMFLNSQATELDLSKFDTSKVTDMKRMFSNSQATELDLSSFDTSKVEDMFYMFNGSKATKLDLSSFDTSEVTDMSYMFSDSQATELDLNSFDTSKVTYMGNMFYESQATKGYARTQEDANKFNGSSNKPVELNFVIKGISEVNFETNGNNDYEKAHSTKVNVEILEDNLAELKYQWTNNSTFPTLGTWNNFSDGDTLSVDNKTGNYYLHIKATGELGITTEETSNVFKLDSEVPTLTLSASTSSPTNQDIVITATATDEHSDIKQIRMVDGDWENTDEMTISISENGTYTFEAEDEAGNTTKEKIEITNIDKTAPSAPIINGSNEWQSNNQTITITHGTDTGGSEVDKTEYKIGDDGTWKTYSKPFDIVQEGQTTIYAQTIDKAGNRSAIAETTIKIDRTTPQLDLLGDNPLVIEAGMEYIELGATAQDNVDGDISKQINMTGEVDIGKLGVYEIRYHVTDSVGNAAVEVVRAVHVVAPKVILIEPDQVAVPIYAGSLIKIKDSDTTIQLPNDLPAGTFLQVLNVQVEEQRDLKQVGEVYDFHFTYPKGSEDDHGDFILTMGVDETSDQVALYHFQGAWQRIGGTLEGNVITATVSDFSKYGVFVEKEIEVERTVEKEIEAEKTVEKETGDLPPTATNQYNWLITGIILMVLGSGLWFIRRKRKCK